jgi:hypothetical protein
MNRKLTFLIGIGLLLSAGCHKNAQPMTPVSVQNPTSYELISYIMVSGPVASGFYFTYDTANLLSSYKQFAYSTSATYVIPGDSLPYTSTFIRNNGVINQKITHWDSAGATNSTTYQYNSNGQNIAASIALVYPLPNNPDTTVIIYAYDSRGNLATETYEDNFGGGPDSFYYSYNAQNNLSVLTETRAGKTVYQTYDGKINFVRAINGLLPNDGLSMLMDAPPAYCPNNPIIEAGYYNPPSTLTKSYQYNEAGLPISITYGLNGPTATLTYQKFK